MKRKKRGRERSEKRQKEPRDRKKRGRKEAEVRRERLRVRACKCVCVCGYLWLTRVQCVVNVKQSNLGWWRPGLVINVDIVRRGQPVDIHYCSQLNEAGATETPTTPGQPHTRCVHILHQQLKPALRNSG